MVNPFPDLPYDSPCRMSDECHSEEVSNSLLGNRDGHHGLVPVEKRRNAALPISRNHGK